MCLFEALHLCSHVRRSFADIGEVSANCLNTSSQGIETVPHSQGFGASHRSCIRYGRRTWSKAQKISFSRCKCNFMIEGSALGCLRKPKRQPFSKSVRFEVEVEAYDPDADESCTNLPDCAACFTWGTSVVRSQNCTFPWEALADAIWTSGLCISMDTHNELMLFEERIRSSVVIPLQKRSHESHSIQMSNLMSQIDSEPCYSIHDRFHLCKLPAYCRTLYSCLQEFGCTHDFEEGPILLVKTWFLHASCTDTEIGPRTLILDRWFLNWPHDIQHLWSDYIDPRMPLEVSLRNVVLSNSRHSGPLIHVSISQPNQADCGKLRDLHNFCDAVVPFSNPLNCQMFHDDPLSTTKAVMISKQTVAAHADDEHEGEKVQTSRSSDDPVVPVDDKPHQTDLHESWIQQVNTEWVQLRSIVDWDIPKLSSNLVCQSKHSAQMFSLAACCF